MFSQGELDGSVTWAERSFELVGEVKDPDLAADVNAIAAMPAAALGQFDRARSFADRHEDATVRLTPHHRLHGVAVSIEVEELAGNWAGVQRLEGLVRERVNANLATPCVRSPRSLLLCTIAAEMDGDSERAAELEDSARRLQHEGFERAFLGPELRLALVREDLGAVERLLGNVTGGVGPTWFGFSGSLARFDALSALGRRDDVERLVAEGLPPGSLVEAVGLRALGQVREDEGLLRQALDRFEAMGLDWYTAETRKLVAQS